MKSVNSRMAIGIAWMVGARLMDRAIGLVNTLILARLLVPADFGLVAMATAIGGVLDLLGAFNFDLALIQKEKAESRHYNTVWTFNLLFGICCGLALVALAVPAATFYKETRLTEVMYALSLSYFISAFSNIGIVNFRKELDFKSEFSFIFTRRIVTFVITMLAAYTLRSYWALIIGMTAGRAVGAALSYIMNSYRPTFTLSATRELFHFSKWMLVNNFLFFLLHDGCTFVVGRLFGVTTLGTYSVSYEISSLPSTELVAPINRVTFPGFSKMTTLDEKANAYLKVLGMISLIVLPIGIGTAAVAQPMVLTMLGAKWSSAVPLIQLLAIHGAISALRGNDGPLWLALGKPREVTILVAAFLSILFPALFYFVPRFGVVGIGFAYLAAHVPTQPYSMSVTKRLLKLRWAQLAEVIWRPCVSVLVMYLGIFLFDQIVVDQIMAIRLLTDVAFGAALYSSVVIALWLNAGKPRGAENLCIDWLADFAKRVGSAFGKTAA